MRRIRLACSTAVATSRPSLCFLTPVLVFLAACAPPGDRQGEAPSSPIASERGWEAAPSLDVARSENPAIVLDGAIFTMGGLVSSPQGMGATDSVERYEPGGDGWEPIAPLPAGRHHSMAAADDGLLYHLGGMDNSGFNPIATSWVFDPGEEWTEIAALPEPVGAAGAAVIDGTIYVVGGVARGNGLFAYDPTVDSWSTLADMEQSREHTAAVALDGKLWVLGGRWGPQMLNEVEIFDPATGAWSPGPAMIEERSGFGATVVDDKIVVAGGEVFSPTKALSSVEILIDGTWESIEPLPNPLHGMSLVTVENVVYVIGGSVTAADVDNPGEVWSIRP